MKLMIPGCCVAAMIAGYSGAAYSAEPQQREIETVVVVATRSPRPLSDVAGSVTTIEAGELADQVGIDMADLARYTPSISIPRAGTRFGWGSYSLRGVGGNRVAIELDGVPVANHFAIGSYSNAGRDVVDISLLRRVEVLYGPASTLYGSDALGGVIAYQTYDPDDLARTNDPYLSVGSSFRGDQQSHELRATTAWTGQRRGVLLSAGQRKGKQRDAGAANGLAKDHQDWDSGNLFARMTQDLPAGRLSATVDLHRHDAQTDIHSLLGTGRFRSTTLLKGDDKLDRERLSLSYDFDADKSWLSNGQLLAYHQNTDTTQYTLEERAGRDLRRHREFEYGQRSQGIEFNATARIVSDNLVHRLGYGVEYIQTESAELRDGFQTALDGTGFTNIMLGEQFPVRDFPLSQDFKFGLYLQDEIRVGNWTLIPALRFDQYRLKPQPDTIYLDDNPGADVVRIERSRLSPRFGLVYDIGYGWSGFAQYVRGFRAPPFEDANIGLDIPLFNIRALPNPDLRSETSEGLEVGVRRHSSLGKFAFAMHYTEFNDFIDSRARLGVDPETGVILFQSRNLSKAKIYGAEFSLEQQLTPQLTSSVAVAFARGSDTSSKIPINSIDPAELMLGIDWQVPRLPLSAQLKWTLVENKDRIDNPGDELAGTAGFGVLDLTGQYERGNVTLRGGVFNLFDRAYWRWSSVSKTAADDPARALLSEPGRYAGLSVLLQW